MDRPADVRLGGSFRDPAGFVFERDGELYRQLNPSGFASYDTLMASGLAEALHGRGLLVAHQEVPSAGSHRLLKPARVPFVSYPYEWCFGQLRAAALLTLEVLAAAVERGQILRDATAYNVQFLGPRPIFIDTLSFEPWVEGTPWVAYRQFCQHFLAPLALMAKVDVRLGALLRTHLDGIPLDLAGGLLPWSTRLSWGLGLHLHAHARSQRRHADSADRSDTPPSGGGPGGPGRFGRAALLGLIDSLRSAVEGLTWRPQGTEWGDYYETAHYGEAALAAKREGVLALLREGPPPRCVWDLGANRGVFSQAAAELSSYVVAFDIDPAAVERAFLARHDRVLPLLQDLGNPSPAQGWALQERDGLLARGPADVCLGLALIHHLAIGNNVPLEQLAAFFARTAPRVILEWVPKGDVQVRRLLASRPDIFPDYTEAGFEAAVRRHFHLRARRPVPGTDRSLYLLERS